MLLALGTVLAALAAMVAGTAREADAAYPGANGRIAFVSDRTTGVGVDNPTGDYEIFVMNADGSGRKNLTRDAVPDLLPAFSPDGKKIAFHRTVRQNVEISVLTLGTGERKRLTDNPAYDLAPDWRPLVNRALPT